MANSGGKITSPVSFADVNAVLGTSYTTLNEICTTSKVKRWARFKPIRHSSKTILTATQRHNAHWGLNVPFITESSRLMNSMVYSILQSSTQEYWQHQRPSGGTNSPYRLTDYVAKPNDATTQPWVGSLAGYNHNPSFPVLVSFSGNGIKKNGDVYEINLQSAGSTITWTITNQGEDLCVQDFCNWNIDGRDGCNWRPVAQLFYPNGTTPWYQVTRATAMAGGTQITATRSTVLTVSLSTASKVMNQLYHACIGIGCTDTAANGYPTDNENLFILPFDKNLSTYWLPQFYYKLRFVNYYTHNIKVTQVWYWGTTSGVGRWKQATNTGGSQSFTIGNDIQSGNIGVVMEIDRTDVTVYFVSSGSSSSVSPKFYIQALESVNAGSSTTRGLLPKVERTDGVQGWVNPPAGYISIDSDSSYSTRKTALKQTVRAELPHGLSRGASASYHMQTQVGTAGFVEVNSFSISVSS